MAGDKWRVLAATLLVAGCRSTPPTRIILWEETQGGFVAEYLTVRDTPFESDGRGLILPRDPDSHRGLIDLLGVLRGRRDVIANNLANAETTSARITRTESGFDRHHPYVRKTVLLRRVAGGPPLVEVVEDASDAGGEFDPGHPHSVQDPNAADFGWVFYPNVVRASELIDLAEAARSYEQVLEALKAWRDP